jgi:ubiquinone/menaquinone biosynthesis C-methylase UbiE
MLDLAAKKTTGYSFYPYSGDMLHLPLEIITSLKRYQLLLEFISDARAAVDELFRVTRPGGCVVIATLNSLSPWASCRRAKTKEHILQSAFSASPSELLACSPLKGIIKLSSTSKKATIPNRPGKSRNRARLRIRLPALSSQRAGKNP